MQRQLVRLLFASVFCLFFVQWFFIRTFGEPYPALAFPSFSGSPESDGRVVAFSRVVVFVDSAGHEYRFASRDLLAKYRQNEHPGILRIFSPPEAVLNRRIEQFQSSPLYALLPGYEYAKRRRKVPEYVEEVRAWFAQRGEEMIGDRPVAVSVLWFDEVWSVESQSLFEQLENGRYDLALD